MMFGSKLVLEIRILTEGIPFDLDTLDAIESVVPIGIPSLAPMLFKKTCIPLEDLGKSQLS